jgi:hypothetical protein
MVARLVRRTILIGGTEGHALLLLGASGHGRADRSLGAIVLALAAGGHAQPIGAGLTAATPLLLAGGAAQRAELTGLARPRGHAAIDASFQTPRIEAGFAGAALGVRAHRRTLRAQTTRVPAQRHAQRFSVAVVVAQADPGAVQGAVGADQTSPTTDSVALGSIDDLFAHHVVGHQLPGGAARTGDRPRGTHCRRRRRWGPIISDPLGRTPRLLGRAHARNRWLVVLATVVARKEQISEGAHGSQQSQQKQDDRKSVLSFQRGPSLGRTWNLGPTGPVASRDNKNGPVRQSAQQNARPNVPSASFTEGRRTA